MKEVDAMADAKIPPDAPSAQSESRAPVKLTPKRLAVLRWLGEPTQSVSTWGAWWISKKVAGRRQAAWANAALLPLRAAGLVSENEAGGWRITSAGLAALREAEE